MGGVPDPLNVNLSGSLGTVGPVAVNPIRVDSVRIEPGPIGPVTVAGIPDTFHINIDHIPKIQLGIDTVTLHLDPVEFSLKITELPRIRMHQPMDINLGLSWLGMELLCVRLCGETQMITEPYVPNPCEHCGQGRPLSFLDGAPSESVPKMSVSGSSGESS